MKSKLAALCLLLIALASMSNGQTGSTSSSAQLTVPRLVSFSGHAADATGKAISGVAGVTFAIYRDQDGGSPLWIETQTVTTDAKGNFTAQLGVTKTEGLPLDVFASGEARWLGVSVNGGAEQPRVLLLSVPYALKAADAQTLNGLPASAFLLATPATTTTVSSPANPTTTGASSAPPPASSNVTTMGGTVNTLPLFTTATNIQSSIVTQTGTTSVNIKGKLVLPATGVATATAGKNSQAQNLVASTFNSSTSTAVPQTFQWQAEPANNNTTSASGTLNLLFGQGTSTPAETGLKVAGNGQITFATGQTFPGTGQGTITGITTASGSGLTGGGTSGTLNLGLLSTCTTNQILKWNGTAWVCATQSTGSGTVTSVALSAPSSDFTVTGSPITSSGTLGLNWILPPDTKPTPNAIAKRDATGTINANFLVANQSASGYSVSGTDNSPSTAPGTGVAGISVYGNGVSGFSTQGNGVIGGSTNYYGVSGSSVASFGVYGASQSAVAIYGTSASSSGVYGESGPSAGVSGASSAWVGVYGTGPTGVYGLGTNYGLSGFGTSSSATGVYGNGSLIGVDAESSSGGGEGLFAYNASSGDGILSGTGQASGYAAWFNGQVYVNGNLGKAGGSFKIDHPLDPANKYLSHSFVESPDMKNIYDGVATLGANGEAVIEMPDWFGALNRDFRYQLTCIGGFAPVYVAEELSENHFKIGGGKPGMRVSWQVTGIRQDVWANAHRIPVEEEKPEAERGSYLHPELYGASDDNATVWRRHPETWKHMKEQAAKSAAKK